MIRTGINQASWRLTRHNAGYRGRVLPSWELTCSAEINMVTRRYTLTKAGPTMDNLTFESQTFHRLDVYEFGPTNSLQAEVKTAMINRLIALQELTELEST